MFLSIHYTPWDSCNVTLDVVHGTVSSHVPLLFLGVSEPPGPPIDHLVLQSQVAAKHRLTWRGVMGNRGGDNG